MNSETERKKLVKRLLSLGYLKSKKVIEAMSKVPREEFVPEYLRRYAYDDRPLEIGSGQTISAPHMVAIMTEALDVKPKQKILEIGSGSGYQAAILAEMVKENGKIYTIERIKSIKEFAERNLSNLGYKNVKVILGDGTLGYGKEAPYDRIIVTAGAPKIPKSLVLQLKLRGKLLIPIGGRMYQDLILVEKEDNEKIKKKNLCGCVFVPLIGKEGW